MTTKQKRGTAERHYFGDSGQPIGADQNGQSKFWRRGVEANAKFAEAMADAGYRAEKPSPSAGTREVG